MKARVAAILTCPAGLGTDEADSGATAVVVDAPGGLEEGFYVIGVKEVGCAVGAVENCDSPGVSEWRGSLGKVWLGGER